ncbi:hypothetical protein Q4Q39_11060 [Flavivirga amylovorans]|uniref:PrsW family intramembrane metalloprotease n=1 Tax=Flavivirga amylovorans TaxID=870486 RepID=A0ABT8X253_9FLAO|nr:hypothetical protein [Flavivirga amylovorans]MDO5987942.1 hypothetical protein [Flavivirga amylovorans]
MKNITSNLNLTDYKLSKKTAHIIFVSPIIITFIVGLLLILKPTKSFGFWLLDENAPIEMLTFVSLIIGGIFGSWFSLKYSKYMEKYITVFYLFFSICLILIAMEEIAWGQWFFHFDTPEKWAKINKQGETTIHNIKGIHGHNENLRLLFGLGGLIGIFVGNYKKLKKISVPKLLFFWFLIIFFHSLLDVLTSMDNNNQPMQRISELIEMLIGGSALLYLWLNYKMIKSHHLY